VRNLALKYPSSPLNNGSLLIYLTARDTSRGEAAVEALYADDQLVKAKALRRDGGLTDIRYHNLDISRSESIQNFRELLGREHPDGIDIVVNNAGINMDGFSKLRVVFVELISFINRF
jgi:carbonyl reductase 1